MELYGIEIVENPAYTESGNVEVEVEYCYSLEEALFLAEKEYQNILDKEAGMVYDNIYVNKFSVNDDDWKNSGAKIKNNKLVYDDEVYCDFEEFYLKFECCIKSIPIYYCNKNSTVDES